MGRKERKERRQKRLELEQERKRDEARTQPRSVGDDVSWMGAGTRRLQIVVSESFEPVLCWEIRTDATVDVNGKHVDGTVVYESIGISPESERVSGYRRLAIAAQELDRLVEWYSEIAVPLQILQTDYAVFDGTTYQIALFSTIGNSWRFRWQEGEAPAGWAEMVRTTSRAVGILRQLRESSNEV